MTAVRLIPLPIHAALRMLTGLLMMVAPFVVGFDAPATLIAVALGAVTVGVALGAVPDDRGRPAMAVSTLHTLDYGLVLGALGAAGVIALGGDGPAAATVGAIALVQLVGNVLTKYSARA